MRASRLDKSRLDKSPSRWLALFVLCAGMLMIILDQTIVNVAQPAIQRDLGFSQSSLAWVVNAYLIPFGGLLLLAGRAQIGSALGVAVLATISSARSQELLVTGASLDSARPAVITWRSASVPVWSCPALRLSRR